MRLDALAGNRRLKHRLAEAERLPNAILLGGAKGSGKHTLSTLLAAAMVCDRPGDAPCGACPNCKLVFAGIHPDVVPLERLTAAKDAGKRDIVVDTVRTLRADAFVRPNQARRKVYLVSPADAMNPNAQNALLKILEDGPDYAAFLLLAENPMALLETIRSRCVRYDLDPVSPDEAVNWLRSRYPGRDEEALRQAAQACGGILGRAVELLEGMAEDDPKAAASLEALIRAIGGKSELALMEWSVAVQNDKLSRAQLALIYDRLFCRSIDALAGRPAGADLAAAMNPAQLATLCDLAKTAGDAMERNASPANSAGWFAVGVWEIMAGK